MFRINCLIYRTAQYSPQQICRYKVKGASILAGLVLVFMATMPAQGAAPLSVFVSIAPQAFFVERIGGDLVDVSVLVPPGRSPATYAPTPAQMMVLSRASVLFSVGVPFEASLMPKIRDMAPGLEIVDTRQGIALRRFGQNSPHRETKMHPKESPGDSPDHHDKQALPHETDHKDHDHAAEDIDPHIWMSPALVQIQARTMCEALVKLSPAHETVFRTNLETFRKELARLDQEISRVLTPIKGGTIFVFHPVFGYFADTYGLHQLAVEQGGKAPRGKDLVAFIRLAKENHVRVIFVQPQFDRRVAEKIASAINGAVVALDPLARDYMDNLRRMAGTIREALK